MMRALIAWKCKKKFEVESDKQRAEKEKMEGKTVT